MGRCCIVCRKNGNPSSSLTFHRFPHESEQKNVWLSFLRLKPEQITKHSSVCSNHFKEDAFLITPGGRKLIKKGVLPIPISEPKIIDTREPIEQCRVGPNFEISPRIFDNSSGTEKNIDFEEKVNFEDHSPNKFEVENNGLRQSCRRGMLSLSGYSDIPSTYYNHVNLEIKSNSETIFIKKAVPLFLCDRDEKLDLFHQTKSETINTSSSDESSGSNFEKHVREIYLSDPEPNFSRCRKQGTCVYYHENDSDSSNTLSASENEFFNAVTIKDSGDNSNTEFERTRRKKKKCLRKRFSKPVLTLSSIDFSSHRKAVRHFRAMRRTILSQRSKIRALQQTLRRLKTRVIKRLAQ